LHRLLFVGLAKQGLTQRVGQLLGCRLVTRVLFHLMIELMRMTYATAPKAILTQLIFATLLTLVPEAVEMRACTTRTCDWMCDALHNCEPMEYAEPNETGRSDVRHAHGEKVVQFDWL